MMGGIANPKKGAKIAPNNEIYTLKVGNTDAHWFKEKVAGELPPERSQHTALAMPGDKLFVFGGHHTPQVRLNDVWILNCKQGFEWSHPDNQDTDTPKNAPHKANGPEPRANSAAVLVGNKIWLFGGHGGESFTRKAFNDLYSFDCDTHEW